MFKKVFRILGYILLVIISAIIIAYIVYSIKWHNSSKANMALLGDVAPTLTVDGQSFRDLNKNGSLDIFEDATRSIEERVENLLSQMTIEEKAGLQFITMITIDPGGKLSEIPTFKDPFSFMFPSNSTMVARKLMSHFNIFQAPDDPEVILEWHNALQEIAEKTRLGIPVTIASDPRHGTKDNIGAGIPTPFFSGWPSALGLGATGDSTLVQGFGEIARQEYTAIGIRLSLHPQIDLATEPRWGRISGSFSEDAELSAKLVQAYIRGFQGDSLHHGSVACMTKHFPGGGPQADGEDAHFDYGADQAYPGNNFDYHLIPFKAAIKAGTAQIMPYYGVPKGIGYEEVGFGFNKEIITGILRDSLHFEGVVCTDWGITSDMFVKKASAWGVEHLTVPQRVEKILDAGCDMIGGDNIPEVIVELVNSGQISEERINVSVRRILTDKFELGLFDNPYLDKNGLSRLNTASSIEAGMEAQRKSLVLLKNEEEVLPLEKRSKVYVKGMDNAEVSKYADVVDRPDQADFNLLKLTTPFDPRSDDLLERFFHQGRLYFNKKERDEYLEIIRSKPTIVVMTLERPTIFPEINLEAKAVVADFFCTDEAILQVVFGEYSPSGRLPVEIPSSEAAVNGQFEDVPYDSKDPLYPFGYGLNYPSQ